MKKKLNCVLLVDDNEADNFFHKRIIEQAGIADHIEIVLNGQEALDFLTTRWLLGQKDNRYDQPSLIFLDINMPVMNGWEFLEEYSKLNDAQKADVIIVMLTTSLNPADITRTEKTLGCGCFLFKPLTVEMLGEIMQKYFPENL